MYINREYTPRRRRRRGIFSRYWPLFLLIALAIIFYETRPQWLFTASQQAAPTPTRNAITYFENAERAVQSGDYNTAIAAYKQLAQMEPQNPAPLIALSRIYLMLYGQYETADAYQYAKSAVDLAGKDPEALNTLARVLDWQSQLEDAADMALESLDIDPNNPTTLAVLSEIYNDAGNPDRAQQYLDEAFKIDPNHPLALRNQATLYERSQEYEKAIQTLDQAIAAAPNRVDFYVDKAREQRGGLGDFSAAADTLRAAARIHASVPISTLLGEALNQAEDPFAAVSVLRDAVEENPNFGPAQIQLGMALYARRNYEDAALALEKGARLYGEDRMRSEQMLYLGLSYVFQDPQNCDKAGEWLQKTIQRDLDAIGQLNSYAVQGLQACDMEYLNDGTIIKNNN